FHRPCTDDVVTTPGGRGPTAVEQYGARLTANVPEIMGRVSVIMKCDNRTRVAHAGLPAALCGHGHGHGSFPPDDLVLPKYQRHAFTAGRDVELAQHLIPGRQHGIAAFRVVSKLADQVFHAVRDAFRTEMRGPDGGFLC